ncbi:hypothetical protein lerEdw1_010696 [Lerista edwardsae]|nr:hypothetical protein lerEdw1_010696 [Lerista edwardsae]
MHIPSSLVPRTENGSTIHKEKCFHLPATCLLEHKIFEMEERHKEELNTLKEEKENLQGLVSHQSYIIQELERQLTRATNNNSILQKQQLELMDTVHSLVSLCSKEGVLLKSAKREDDKPFRDCADAYQAGFNKTGVYTIYVNNISEPKKLRFA